MGHQKAVLDSSIHSPEVYEGLEVLTLLKLKTQMPWPCMVIIPLITEQEIGIVLPKVERNPNPWF